MPTQHVLCSDCSIPTAVVQGAVFCPTERKNTRGPCRTRRATARNGGRQGGIDCAVSFHLLYPLSAGLHHPVAAEHAHACGFQPEAGKDRILLEKAASTWMSVDRERDNPISLRPLWDSLCKLDRIYTSGVTPTSLISDHADSGWAGMLRFRVTTGFLLMGPFPAA